MKKRNINSFKVDILVTFYNQEDCVDRTLKSLIDQKTDFDFQIIIGDDGSTDRTQSIIKKWILRYPNKITLVVMDRENDKRYEPIERVSENRKKLLSYITSEFFLFLDGDDYYIDNMKLQKQYNILNQRNDCICCCHNVNLIWEESKKSKLVNNLDKAHMISKEKYWVKSYMVNSSFMFRNILDEKSLINLSNTLFDDNSITLFFVQYGNVFYIPDVMINYVQKENSSWNKRSEIMRDLINSMDYYDEKQFAKSMSFYSLIRHSNNFYNLFKYRKDLDIDSLDEYWVDRVNHYGGMYLKKLITFNSLNFIQKAVISIETILLKLLSMIIVLFYK